MANAGLSDRDLAQLKEDYERQIRWSAAVAQLQSGAAAPRLEKSAVSTTIALPPDPDFWRTMALMGRYATEAIAHLPDAVLLGSGIGGLLASADGQRQLAEMQKALSEKKDSKVFQDLTKMLVGASSYGSATFAVVAEGHGFQGVAGVTGIALPLKGTGKPKWFSGVEQSKGLIIEFTAGLIIGGRMEEPQHLHGQFYGVHVGLEIGAALGSTLYFDTSDELKYQGFATTVGVGLGGGIAVLRGWEIVTSD